MKLLDLQSPHNQLLRERLQPYIEQATSPATRKSYRNALRHFRAWGGTLPATADMVAEYLAAHAERLAGWRCLVQGESPKAPRRINHG